MNKVEISKKHYINQFFAFNNIKRENYLKDSMFLNFFYNWLNKTGRWSQKFAVGVTKLMPPDEIRSFDGMEEEETVKLVVEEEETLSQIRWKKEETFLLGIEERETVKLGGKETL